MARYHGRECERTRQPGSNSIAMMSREKCCCHRETSTFSRVALSRDRAVEMIGRLRAAVAREPADGGLRKLYRQGKLGHRVWTEIRQVFHESFLAFKAQQSAKQKESEGGANYYIVKRHRVGSALLSLMRRALNDGSTTYTKASRVLGVKPRNVEYLLSASANRGPR